MPHEAPLPWDEVARRLEAGLGLHFPPARRREMLHGLQAAARQLGLADAAACAALLLAREPTAQERRVLLHNLTVGETYFFRDPALFALLREQVLPPLLAQRAAGTRHLRLWSAGCSTGEEPWSLAMLLAGLLPDWQRWSISILATDINPVALEKARAGLYGDWSLRSGLPPLARRFLLAREDGRHEVDPVLRPLVRFAELNLAAADYPTAATGTLAMDLVLCRNVLIYFAPEAARHVLQRLGGSLVESGWLLASPADLPCGELPGLVREGSAGSLRRQPAAPPTPALAAIPAPRPAPTPGAAPSGEAAPGQDAALVHAAAPRSGRHPLAEQPRADASAAARPQAPAPACGELARRARACADAGDLAQAEALCRQAQAAGGFDADATWLLATILAERGDLPQAEAELERTLFLDPGHVPARLALASLHRRAERPQAARRQLGAALARLAGHADDSVVQGSGGHTAGNLRAALARGQERR